ncbi:MAG: ComEC/Rec2 family competence protein [Alloprevotella sp.]
MPFYKLEAPPLPPNPFRQAPLLLWALLLATGIAAGWLCRALCDAPLLCWISTGLWTGWALLLCASRLRRKGECGGKAGALWAMLCVMVTGAALAADEWRQTVVEWPADERVWTGRIETVFKQKGRDVTLGLRLVNDDVAWNGKRVRVMLKEGAALNVQPGDLVAFSARMEHGGWPGNPGDFDYRSYLTTQGLSGTAWVRPDCYSCVPVPEEQLSLADRLHRLRRQMTDRYAHCFPPHEASLLAALTLGDKSQLADDTRTLFASSGTSHVLALSGLHLGILFGVVQLLVVGRLRRRSHRLAASLVVVAALWLFVVLTGSPLSLQRAACMLTVLQLGQLASRHSGGSLNHLSLAVIVLLAYSPLALFDVGFQLSVMAVASIVLGQTYFWGRFPLPLFFPSWHHASRGAQVFEPVWKVLRRVIWPFVTVSLSAQVGTAPWVAYYFHQFSPFALLANFVAVPGAYLLLCGALCFFALPFDAVRAVVVPFMQAVAHALTASLQELGTWPGATVEVYAHALTLVCWGVAVPLGCSLLLPEWQRCRRRLTVALTSCLLAALCCEGYHHRPNRLPPQVAVYRLPHTSLLHLVVSADESYFYSPEPSDSVQPRLAQLERQWFKPLHLAEPVWLRESRFDAPHVARRGPVFALGKTRLLLLNTPIAEGGTAARPVKVDVLIVSQGCGWPESVLPQVQAAQVVLDPTLRAAQRRQWRQACAEQNLPCHDVQAEGAFCLECSL